MANDPVLHLLGLARKGRLLEIGEEPAGAAARAGHAKLLLLANDAAPNTCRRCAHFGQAGCALWLQLPFTKAELGFQLGRGSCAILAVTDPGMAAAVAEKLAARDPEYYGPAARQLREKADKALQRQRERRQHEKNLRLGKHKPWAPPPQPKSVPAPARAPRAGAQPKPPRPGAAARHGKDGPGRPAQPAKSGPGMRRLSGKFRHNP